MAGNLQSLARFNAREKLVRDFDKYQKQFVATVAQRDALNIKVSNGDSSFDTINARNYYSQRSEFFAQLVSNITTLSILQKRMKDQYVSSSVGAPRMQFYGDVYDQEEEKVANKIRAGIKGLAGQDHNFKTKKPKQAKLPKPKPRR